MYSTTFTFNKLRVCVKVVRARRTFALKRRFLRFIFNVARLIYSESETSVLTHLNVWYRRRPPGVTSSVAAFRLTF